MKITHRTNIVNSIYRGKNKDINFVLNDAHEGFRSKCAIFLAQGYER